MTSWRFLRAKTLEPLSAALPLTRCYSEVYKNVLHQPDSGRSAATPAGAQFAQSSTSRWDRRVSQRARGWRDIGGCRPMWDCERGVLGEDAFRDNKLFIGRRGLRRARGRRFI